jgi:hypothetical protein
MYLFCLFYILCLNLLSSISLFICCIRMYALAIMYVLYVCMHVCTLLPLLACDIWGIWTYRAERQRAPGYWRDRGRGYITDLIGLVYPPFPGWLKRSREKHFFQRINETVRYCPFVRRDTGIKWNGKTVITSVSLGKRGRLTSERNPSVRVRFKILKRIGNKTFCTPFKLFKEGIPCL